MLQKVVEGGLASHVVSLVLVQARLDAHVVLYGVCEDPRVAVLDRLAVMRPRGVEDMASQTGHNSARYDGA